MFAPMAKLDIASVYGTEDWGFEPLWAHQTKIVRAFKRGFFLFVLFTLHFSQIKLVFEEKREKLKVCEMSLLK